METPPANSGVVEPTSKLSPPVSIVVCTDGRLEALKATLASLRHQDYENFEVCVVHGPTGDGTKEYLETLSGVVKVSECSERNLSKARNIGIALAAGEIIAFIDDDAIAEPEWLSELAAAIVGGVEAAGGLVYDSTGRNLQHLYAACDRLGNAIADLKSPIQRQQCYPFVYRFPYLQGTNCAFKRARLVQIGGFDEEYEFHLDEVDLCCRLVDLGLKFAQLPTARVHHKALPSHIRNRDNVTVRKYAVMKSKIYFSLTCNRGHVAMPEVVADNLRFVNALRRELEAQVEAGRLFPAELGVFAEEVERAWATGFARGAAGVRRVRPHDYFDVRSPFVPYQTARPKGPKHTLVFLSGGDTRGREDSAAPPPIAQTLASSGHKVHVLKRGEGVDRVNMEGDVWVHRLAPSHIPRPVAALDQVSEDVWNSSVGFLKEIYRINRIREVGAVESSGPECLAIAFDGRFPLRTPTTSRLDGASGEDAVERFLRSLASAAGQKAESSREGLRRHLALLRKVERKDIPFRSDIGDDDVFQRELEIEYGEKGYLLRINSSFAIVASRRYAYLSFWTHPWSGIVEVRDDSGLSRKWDLFGKTGWLKTFRMEVPRANCKLLICRTGERNPSALDSEVIMVNAAEADQ